MKTFISFVFLVLTAAISVSADEPFFPTQKGMTLTTFNYDAKGRKTPRDIRTVLGLSR